MSLSRALKFLTLPAFLGLLLLPTPGMGQTGQEHSTGPSSPTARSVPPDTSGIRAAPKPYSSSNNINANARHLVPDGSSEDDFIDNVNTQAWFSFPIYFEHTYAIEAYVPFNYNNQSDTSLDMAVFETDGTTGVFSTDERGNQPNLDETGFRGGQRRHLDNFSTDRFVHLSVQACCGNTPPAAGIEFHIRVVDLTQTAARWTTNGYTMLIALNNSSRQTATGYVDYYNEAGAFLTFDFYSLAVDGSVQISHAANVTIGGVLFGGIRVIPTSGAPGTITAHEYNFNTVVGNYLQFPFSGRQWVTGTPRQ